MGAPDGIALVQNVSVETDTRQQSKLKCAFWLGRFFVGRMQCFHTLKVSGGPDRIRSALGSAECRVPLEVPSARVPSAERDGPRGTEFGPMLQAPVERMEHWSRGSCADRIACENRGGGD